MTVIHRSTEDEVTQSTQQHSRATPDFRSSLAALVMAMLSVAMGVGFIVPLLPIYADTLGASGAWVGVIFAANPFVRAVTMMIFGSIADYRSKKGLMLIGLCGYVVVSLGFVAATQAYHLLLLRVMQGIFSALVAPIARAYAGDISPEGQEGFVMGRMNLGFFTGFALGPIVGGVFADVFGLHAPFYAMTLLTVVAIVMVWRLVPEQAGQKYRRIQITADRLLDSIELIKDDVIKGILTIRSSVELGRGVLMALLPLFGHQVLGLSASEVGLVVALRSLISAAMQPRFGGLADQMNRKILAVIGFSLAPVGFFLIPLTASAWHLMGISVILGVSSGIAVPATLAIAVDRGRHYGMGKMMGLEATTQSMALAIGSISGGAVMDAVGMEWAFQIAALVSVVGISISLWYLRHYQQPT